MKVILLQELRGIGKKGQIIETSDGHARNYLIPRKLAIEATAHHINEIDAKRQAEQRRQTSELESAQALGKSLSQAKVRIAVKTGENGRLFGSVTNKEIASVLSAKTGLAIDKKKVILDEPIKTIGEKQVEVKLHAQVSARITVEIMRLDE
ncbi:MAG: 50S ribosomal protein L9 [Clostridiales bacterium]|jgi:large subunit ribosomal protein L9|nr:50S ribosomal protein L9 [Clostridiales bacterium]